MISLAIEAAKFGAPYLMKWLTGSDESRASKVAGAVIDSVKKVTGHDDPKGAVDTLKYAPELMAEFQDGMNAVRIAELEADTEHLESINQTMRVETVSGDKVVRRWRPFFGYVVAITWGLQMGAVSWAIIMTPEKAPVIIAAMSGLALMWSVALGVLGVSVRARSNDKKLAAGIAPSPGLADALKRFIGK